MSESTTAAPSKPKAPAIRIFTSPEKYNNAPLALGRNHASWFIVFARPYGMRGKRADLCLNYVTADPRTVCAPFSSAERKLTFSVGGAMGAEVLELLPLGADAEHPEQQRRCEHLLREARGHDAARIQHDDLVAVRRREVEVVQGHHRGDPQAPDQREQLQLVADVEVVGGLVEDEDPRGLREGAGELYTYLPPGIDANTKVCNVPPLSECNDVFGQSIGRGSFTFTPGKRTTIGQRVRLNDVGKENGELELFVDGKSMFTVSGLVLATADAGRIRGIQMQSFFGGA